MRPPLDTGVAPGRPSAPARSDSAAAREVLRRFHALPEARLSLLREAAEVALTCGGDLFWVGGGVRDLWLERSELDIDLVFDGELWPFAERLATRLGSELRSHPKFLTAELEAPGGIRIDLAQVRSERYATPASLPVVAPGTLESDFDRRDFSINTLAIPLAPEFGERLIDSRGGLPDLAAGLLRTLYPGSFRDDPTRILRGAEFEARFDFSFAAETRAEAERAIADGHVAALSPGRLGEALRRALGRPESAGGVLRRLSELALLASIEPGTERSQGAADHFESAVAALRAAAEGRFEASFPLALLCLALDLRVDTAARLALRLALSEGERELVTRGPGRVRAAIAAITASGAEPLPSVVHARLGALSEAELAVVAAQGAAVHAWVRRELSELRKMRLRIGGRDLIAAGEAAGPDLGRALELTFAARLDGRIGVDEELEFALRAASRASGGAME